MGEEPVAGREDLKEEVRCVDQTAGRTRGRGGKQRENANEFIGHISESCFAMKLQAARS